MKNNNCILSSGINSVNNSIVSGANNSFRGPGTCAVALHKEFARLGKERNKLTYKLQALLPRIAKFEIYRKHNCSSIYEYASKFAGLTHPIVDKALRLNKNLRGKPCLKKIVESEGIHKVALVAKLATPSSDKDFADKVRNMSKQSIEEWARELRAKWKVGVNDTALTHTASGQDDLFSSPHHIAPNQDAPLASLCQAAPPTIKIELDDEMKIIFLKLKKKYGNHLSNKEVLKKILKEVDCDKNHNKIKQKDVQKKEKSQNSLSEKFSREKIKKEKQVGVKRRETAVQKVVSQEKKTQKTPSRYIPAHIKKAAIAKSGGKCAYPGCLKPADVFHHTKRYSEVRENWKEQLSAKQDDQQNSQQSIHDSIIPLCKAHHEFAHNGLIGSEEGPANQWSLQLEAGVNSYADAKHRKFRKG